MNLSREISRSHLIVIGLSLVLVAVAIAFGLYITAASQTGFWIVSRYAEQLRAGHGLVFNAQERALLLPSPLYILLLGAVSALLPMIDISVLQTINLGLAVGIGATAIYLIARRIDLPALPSFVFSVIYLLSWPFLLSTEVANPLASMFCLLTIVLVLNERWQFAGLALACGVLSNPQATLLAIPLLLLATSKGQAARLLAALILPLLVAVLALWLYYGPSLWNGLLILKNTGPVGFGADWLPILLLPIIAIAAWGWFKERANPTVAVLGAWVALSIMTTVLLTGQIGTTLGISAGAIPILILVGLRNIRFQFRPLTWLSVTIAEVVVVAIIIGTGLAVPPVVEFLSPVGDLSQANTIALNSVSTLPYLSTRPDQSIVAFDGQMQPDLKAMLERGDTQSALVRYAPDVLVLRGSGKIRAKDLTSPAAARLGYRPSQEPDTYVRSAPIGTFADVPIIANFGPDIKLTSAALDQSALKPGQLLRVRLDWQFARSASQNVTIDLRLVSGDGDQYLLAHAVDTYDPSVFRAGMYSTYHTLTVVSNAWPGPVRLVVAVVINNGVAARVPINTLAVSTP